MNDDWFTEIDFEDSSYNEHFQRIHNPEQGYAYIQHLHSNLTNNPSSNEQLQGYAQVDFFRATMQYTEEFLLYLLSYIDTNDEFVETLIRGEVRRFCQAYLDDTLQDYFDDNIDFDHRLKTVFGYTEMLEADNPEDALKDADLTADQLGLRIDKSMGQIHTLLTHICEHYIGFIDMYNAVKHGNRFQISPNPEIQVTDDYTYQSDQGFATFLCKTSGDHDQGRPYLANYPLDLLVKHSLEITETTTSLFSYLNRVITDALNEEPIRARTFFGTESTTGESASNQHEEENLIIIWNGDSKTILPQTEELAETVIDPTMPVALRFAVDGSTLRVTSDRSSEPSDAYPLQGKLSLQTSASPKLEIENLFSFTADLTDLDIGQYHELLQYHDRAKEDGFDRIIIEFEDIGVRIEQPFSKVDAPTLEIGCGREQLADLALAQKIVGQELPLPPTFLDGQIERIQEAVSDSPERDDVVDAIEEAQQIGEKVELTAIYAESPEDPDKVEIVTVQEGFLSGELGGEYAEDETGPNTFREFFDDPEIDTEDAKMRLRDMTGSYNQFFESVQLVGLAGMLIQPREPKESMKNSDKGEMFSVEWGIEYDAQTFWYTLHRITVHRID